jgi:hypothetical protein
VLNNLEFYDLALTCHTYCSVCCRSLLPVPILYWQRGPVRDASGSILATIKVLRENATAVLTKGFHIARPAWPTMVETDKGSPPDISAQRSRSSSFTDHSNRSGATSIGGNSSELEGVNESGERPRSPDASRARSPSTGSSQKSRRSSMSDMTSDSDSQYESRSRLRAESGMLAEHNRILPNRLFYDYGSDDCPNTGILARTAAHHSALKADGTDELGSTPSMGIVTDGMC